MVDEIWAEVKGFPDYAVSSHGRVKNLKFDRVLRQTTTSYGKRQVMLRRDGVVYGKYVHRLVAEAFITEFTDDVSIRHHDGDGGNNLVTNLRFRRGRRLGRMVTKPPKAVYRRLRVVETNQIFRTVHDCARHLKTDPSTIYKVLRGEREHHLGLTFEYYFEEG